MERTQIGLCPVTISVFPADLLDLEPFRCGDIELVAGGRSTRSHVGQHGSGVVRPLNENADIHQGRGENKIDRTGRTLLRSAPFQSNVKASPGLASATRDPTVESGPQVRTTLSAPLLGFGELTCRMILGLVLPLGTLPLNAFPLMVTVLKKPWAET
jgi:hypothetical protein